MEMQGLGGGAITRHKGSRRTGGGVRKGELREEGDGLRMGVDRGGSSPSEESKRCMTMCIPGSILTLTTGGVFKVEDLGWGTEFRGYICARIWETIHPIFTGAEFPH